MWPLSLLAGCRPPTLPGPETCWIASKGGLILRRASGPGQDKEYHLYHEARLGESLFRLLLS